MLQVPNAAHKKYKRHKVQERIHTCQINNMCVREREK